MLGWGRDCLSCLLLLVDGRPAAEVPSLSVCPSGWHWPYATKKARRTSEEDEAGNKSKARINRIHPNRLSRQQSCHQDMLASASSTSFLRVGERIADGYKNQDEGQARRRPRDQGEVEISIATIDPHVEIMLEAGSVAYPFGGAGDAGWRGFMFPAQSEPEWSRYNPK
ncbi:hypothetical protein ASPWEDRAFT_24841 [Aspergillus wentii DTO 134E9]|uniref:Uncharacterized protein n=1 Tax=Aspergillus wentii DTO 134E9 TaxID=1073089 RepID=A0A1L9RVK5_ASPWE|nr:uncharacterized protein ASPWEDRAFT_24841 [Aspergillus wentii DTO 134E9]OJJ38970.1 hypothetical protein ASPWEDRAFT_24841 [Aspergillus wentii DTO 134E9]